RRKRVFIEKVKVLPDGAILDDSNLESQQDSALHPDVRFPAVIRFFRRAKLTPAETLTKLLHDRQTLLSRLFRGKRVQPLDFVFQPHHILPAACSNPNSSTTFASFSRFDGDIRTNGRR